MDEPLVPTVATVAGLLKRSDIVWPKYGSDTIEELAECIVAAIARREARLRALLRECQNSVERDAIHVLTPGTFPPERVRVVELAAALRAALAGAE